MANDVKQKSDNRDWIEVLGKEIHSSPTCPFCCRKFDRKAVLRTHMVSCPAQKKPSATISIDSNSSSNSSTAISPVVFENNDSKDSHGSTSSSSRRKKSRMPIRIINPTCLMADEREKAKPLDLDGTIALNELFKNLGKEELSLKTVNLDNLSQPVEVKKEITEISLDPRPKTPEPVKVPSPPPPPPPPTNTAPQQIIPPKPPATVITPQTVIVPMHKSSMKQQKCYCKICKKKFDAVSNLKRHIAMYHYRKRKFGCKHCNFKGYRKYDVTNHLIAMHSMQHGHDLTEHMQTIEETFTREVSDDIVYMDDDADIEMPKVYKSYSKKEEKKMKEKEKESTIAKDTVEIKLVKEEKKEIIVKSEHTQEIPQEQAEVSISIPVITSTPKHTRSSTSLTESKPETSPVKIEKEKEMVPPPTITKRPIRNRVKPVNKDFVYDMSGLIKNDSGYGSEKETTPMRASRRRNTVSMSNDIPPPFTYHVTQSPTKKQIPPPPPILPTFDFDIKNKDEIRGITKRLALALVAQNRAAYGSMPEIPEEKPFFTANKNVPSTHRSGPSPYSSSDEDSVAKQLDMMARKQRRIDLVECPNAVESTTLAPLFKSNEENNMASPPSPAIVPEEKTPPPTPTKRISLLQRYNESKAKKLKLQESLLRSALEN